MKLKLLFLLLSIVSLIGYAQKQPVQPVSNGVDGNHIVVVNKAGRTYVCGASTSQLVKAFGKTKIKKEADEVLGGFAHTYQYKGFEVYFNGKNWEAMDFTASQYAVLLDGQCVMVGDGIEKLSKRFPLSYKNRDKTGMRLNITHKGAITDSYIFIACNAKGIINRIIIANDNS